MTINLNKNETKYSSSLLKVRKILGSWEKMGILCGFKSGRGIIKWYKKGSPPRTEHSNKTQYAAILSKATNNRVLEKELKPKNNSLRKAA